MLSLLPALLMVLPFLFAPRWASGQALPAADVSPISTGFELPRALGSLQYSVSAYESLTTGYYAGNAVDTSTGINGNLAFITTSKLYPLSMVISTGHAWSTSAQPSAFYLDFAVSQVINTAHWNFLLSDSVNYLPSTPSTGISGVPGTGDLGLVPIQVGVDTGQGVLTGYATRVSNVASASASRALTGRTSLQLSGSYNTLQFVGDSSSNGYNSSGEIGSVGLSHSIDHRTTVSGNFSYSRSSFSAGQSGYATETASLQYSRQLSRQLSFHVGAGPQWSGSTGGPQAISTSTNLYVSTGLGYSARFARYSVAYIRSTNNGSGVIAGARSDSLSFSASKTFARVWNLSATSAYSRTTSLVTTGANASFAPQTLVDGIQISRALGHGLSTYASYTLENQSTPGSSAAINVFSGFFQVASIGLTYSPTSIHFGPK